jgi:hypothetical protein
LYKERPRKNHQTVHPGSTKKEIFVDLKAIEKQQAEDIALQANDIVDVPVSVDANILGVVLNNTKPQLVDSYYQSYCRQFYQSPESKAVALHKEPL